MDKHLWNLFRIQNIKRLKIYICNYRSKNGKLLSRSRDERHPDGSYLKLTWCHLYCVFTYIYSLLIEKDIYDCWNVLVKLPCVYVCFSSRDLFIFLVRVSSFFSYFLYKFWNPISILLTRRFILNPAVPSTLSYVKIHNWTVCPRSTIKSRSIWIHFPPIFRKVMCCVSNRLKMLNEHHCHKPPQSLCWNLIFTVNVYDVMVLLVLCKIFL